MDQKPANRIELAPGVETLREAVRFRYSRSSGPGGQNVNKRSTKAELRVYLDDLPLTAGALRRLRRLAGARFIAGERAGDGELEGAGDEVRIESDEHRTQRANREACLDRLRELLVRASAPPKPRKKTAPSRAAKRRRLEEKRQRGEKKGRRGWKPEGD